MTLVFYDGPSMIDGERILLLAGGENIDSKNRKTGPMIQLYILRHDQDPWAAVRSGADRSICGDCIHRARRPTVADPLGKKRTCYVDLRFVLPVWHAERRPGSLFALYNRDVRFGAYGDPRAIPFEVLERIATVARRWTGYTEFWRGRLAQPYRQLLMASVHSPEESAEARELGWRCYRDRLEGEPLLEREIDCPYYSHGTQCVACELCDGSHPGDRRPDISAPYHGPGKVEASREVRKHPRLRVVS